MPIQYKMLPKTNRLVTPAQTNYYPVAVTTGDVDLEELARIVAMRSTLSEADCYGAVIALTEVMAEMLGQGRIVRLDRLGSFQVTIKGTAAASVEEAGKSSIKSGRIVYKPSLYMKKVLRVLKYKKIR